MSSKNFFPYRVIQVKSWWCVVQIWRKMLWKAHYLNIKGRVFLWGNVPRRKIFLNFFFLLKLWWGGKEEKKISLSIAAHVWVIFWMRSKNVHLWNVYYRREEEGVETENVLTKLMPAQTLLKSINMQCFPGKKEINIFGIKNKSFQYFSLLIWQSIF